MLPDSLIKDDSKSMSVCYSSIMSYLDCYTVWGSFTYDGVYYESSHVQCHYNYYYYTICSSDPSGDPGLITSGGGGGGGSTSNPTVTEEVDVPETPVRLNLPCWTDPISSPTIAATSSGILNSGRFNYLRTKTDGTQYYHTGLDIKRISR
jgi:hypothetical protein